MAERRVERTSAFESNVKRLARKHRGFAATVDDFLNTVAKRHNHGAMKIPGLGGKPVYKARLPLADAGKRGGARIIYYRTPDLVLVLAMYAYAKSDAKDIPVKQIRDALSVLQTDQADFSGGATQPICGRSATVPVAIAPA